MKCSVSIERCCGCERFFGFNPDHVPNALANGKLGPVCQDCIDETNRRRRVYGLPILIVPLAAYAQIGGLAAGHSRN